MFSVGLMGPDFFATDDVEIDFAASSMSSGTTNAAATWFIGLAIHTLRCRGIAAIGVELGRWTGKVPWYTGSESLDRKFERRAGIVRIVTHGSAHSAIGNRAGIVTAAMYGPPFGALSFNGVQVTNPQIILVPSITQSERKRQPDIGSQRAAPASPLHRFIQER